MRQFNEEEKKLVTQVLPAVAQELRGAMTNIYIAAGRLAPVEVRERDETVDRNAAILAQSFYRMNRMVGNLSEAAELASDTLYDTRANDDIVGLARSVCERAESLFEDEDVTLCFESDSMSTIILMDAVRIERLLLNLLSNALKFTPKGGMVTVRLRKTERGVRLSVSDTGCGIPAGELETVFERFLDGDPFRIPPRSLGLGLAICRRIAQGHGGSIVVESREDEGTCFTVFLPNRRDDIAIVRQPRTEYHGGFNQTVLELSDALGVNAFLCRMMD